jgi:hypothetical protein
VPVDLLRQIQIHGKQIDRRSDHERIKRVVQTDAGKPAGNRILLQSFVETEG